VRRACEPLFTTKAPGKGTGLGLSVVHRIVEQAGGRIAIDSQLGAGTAVRVFLPRHRGAPDRAAGTGRTESRGCERVIVVDDDRHVRCSISRALRQRGYDVLEAGNGPAALDLLRERQTRPIELLVTDVVMPGMDGRELVDIAHRDQPALPVLYISGYTDDAVAHHGVERAAVDILEKPFACDALATRVRQLLDDAAPQ
jgi:two-component system cell cycle sensor histidine kinase/response regulator CckA